MLPTESFVSPPSISVFFCLTENAVLQFEALETSYQSEKFI